MNTPLAPLDPKLARYVIPTLLHWRDDVSKMTNADELNNGLRLLRLAKSLDNIHPFTGDELTHAYRILRKKARSLPVYEISVGYRDTPPHLLNQANQPSNQS